MHRALPSHPWFFGAILHDVQNIVRLQVMQEARDHVVICVVPTADYSVADIAKIEMRARTKIREAFLWRFVSVIH